MDGLKQQKLILWVLETRSPKSKCWEGHAPSECYREFCLAPSWLLVVASHPWHSLACSGIAPICFYQPMAFFPVCLCVHRVFSSYKDSHIEFRYVELTLNPRWSHSKILNYICKDSSFIVRGSGVLGHGRIILGTTIKFPTLPHFLPWTQILDLDKNSLFDPNLLRLLWAIFSASPQIWAFLGPSL